MTTKHLIWSVAAFFAGALLMIVIRGRDSADPAPATSHADMAAHSTHSTHSADSTHNDASAAADPHADHSAKPPPSPAPQTIDHAAIDPAVTTDPAATFTAWVCEADPMVGMSKKGACPLDGTPLVQRTLRAADYKDLKNAKCPIMGGEAKADIFALYGGKKVRFCCPGCDKGFFADADNIVRTLDPDAGAPHP